MDNPISQGSRNNDMLLLVSISGGDSTVETLGSLNLNEDIIDFTSDNSF